MTIDVKEVKEFIDLLPIDDLNEIQKQGYMYYGTGFVSTGSNHFSTTIRIAKNQVGDIIIKITSNKALVGSTFTFKNARQALTAFNAIFQKFMN